MKSKSNEYKLNGNVTKQTVACYNSYTNNEMEDRPMEKIVTFQLKLVEALNREVLSVAALDGKNKHEWIEKAIREQLKRDKAV